VQEGSSRLTSAGIEVPKCSLRMSYLTIFSRSSLSTLPLKRKDSRPASAPLYTQHAPQGPVKRPTAGVASLHFLAPTNVLAQFRGHHVLRLHAVLKEEQSPCTRCSLASTSSISRRRRPLRLGLCRILPWRSKVKRVPSGQEGQDIQQATHPGPQGAVAVVAVTVELQLRLRLRVQRYRRRPMPLIGIERF
jgi:hypothetical protein